jgi:hypothetical protein
MAVRHGEQYLQVKPCTAVAKPKSAAKPVKQAAGRRGGKRGSDWNKNFDLQQGPKVWQAAQESGHKRSATE